MLNVPHNGSDTSREAADSMREHAVRLLTIVVMHVEKCGARGATSDEVERDLNMSHQTVSARLNQAMHIGLLERTGEKRKTRSGRAAFVYRAAPRQRSLAEALYPDRPEDSPAHAEAEFIAQGAEQREQL